MCGIAFSRAVARILGALCLAACASNDTVFTPDEWLGKEALTAREQPAQASRQSAAELQQQGFVSIGSIQRKVVTATYWGSDIGSAPPPAPAVTADLLRVAGERGGDLVVLTADNRVGSSTTTKQIPIAWRQESRQETYQQRSGTGDAGYQATRTVYYSVPSAWRTESGVEHYVESAGNVWRRDPELQQRAIAWEKAAPERARLAAEQAKAAAEQAQKKRMEERRQATRSLLLSISDLPERGVFTSGLKPFLGENERWGYLDKQGTVVLAPQFRHANPFHEGLALVLGEKGYAFIDPLGAIAVVPKATDAPLVTDFADGMAGVRYGLGDETRWGFMDKSGELVIPAQFREASDFSEGLALVRVDQPDPRWGAIARWGHVDKRGQYVLPPQFQSAGSFHEGLAWARQPGVGGKCGYIDTTGQWVITMTNLVVGGDFAAGVAPVAVDLGKRLGMKWGYIDRAGALVIQPKFDAAFPFFEGRARVRVDDSWGRNGKYGFIDRTGSYVIQPAYANAHDYGDGLAVVWAVWEASLPDWSIHSTPGQILDLTGTVIGEIDNCGLVQWRQQAGASQ